MGDAEIFERMKVCDGTRICVCGDSGSRAGDCGVLADQFLRTSGDRGSIAARVFVGTDAVMAEGHDDECGPAFRNSAVDCGGLLQRPAGTAEE